MKWLKAWKKEVDKSLTVIGYESPDLPGVRIESRKKKEFHPNRRTYAGKDYWEHTSYYLIRDGKEKYYGTLRDAKAAAEKEETK